MVKCPRCNESKPKALLFNALMCIVCAVKAGLR